MDVPIDEILSTSHVCRVVREQQKGLSSHFMWLHCMSDGCTSKTSKAQEYLSEPTQGNIASLMITDILVHVRSLIGIDCK